MVRSTCFIGFLIAKPVCVFSAHTLDYEAKVFSKGTTMNFTSTKHYKYLSLCSLAAVAMLASSMVMAQQTPIAIKNDPAAKQLKVDLSLERFVTVNGKEQTQNTDRAAPGEKLQYVANYHNTTHLISAPGMMLNGVSAVVPIPGNMKYLGAASPQPSAASLDGKRYEPYPLMKRVTQSNGAVVQTPVPWDEYRYLKWDMGTIPADTQKSVKAMVQVLDNSSRNTSN